MGETTLNRWLDKLGAGRVFAALADLVPEAFVLAVDADYNVRFWSGGAEAITGYGEEAMRGAHCLKGVRVSECLEGCPIARDGRVDGASVTAWHRDGSSRTFRRFGQRLTDADGRFQGAVEVLLPVATSLPPVVEPAAASFHGIVSHDPVMQAVLNTVRYVAETDAAVLVRGESGTGKELVAQAIHAESRRHAGPFVAVNCASLAPGLVESELFGHVRGAFTGAVSDHRGLFEQADGGTLFLDEVAELPMEAQARLLRVLQDQRVTPVGSSQARQVDVRVVAATHRALREEVRAGRFREDLMFRLRVVPIFLPPLRDRRGDLTLLLHHFITVANQRGPRRVLAVAPDAMRALLDHRWPGNVRELHNVVSYAFAVGRGQELTLADLPPEFRESPSPAVVPYRPHGVPDAHTLQAALDAHDGHIGHAAASLGVSRATFWRWRKQMDDRTTG